MKTHPAGLRPNRPGFALVVALIAVVLVTILTLAFFARSVLNRQVSFSSTNQIKADMLARSALDLITGELRQEIVDFSAPPTHGYYRPLAATNMLPIPSGVTNADTNSGQFTLAKIAAADTPLNPGANGRLRASAVSVDTASRNGRTQSRWFDSGPQLGTADLPTWVYLTRSGAADPALSPAEGRDPASTNFVTGRFSYTVYNTGGLLNANVAGYSTALLAATNPAVTGKGSLAFADLTALGIGQEKINALVAWRNARTGTNATTFEQWATGLPATNNTNSEALSAAASGHTKTVIGDNAFLSRRDLLRYLEAKDFPTNTAGSLSHTFRALDAPSWIPSNIPGANIAYGDDADKETSINRALPGVKAYNGTMRMYRDDGTFEEVTVTENDPLIRNRFSLAKLAWLGHNGPNAEAFHPSLNSTQRERAILDCFGLKWFNGSGGTSSDARWEYDHGNAYDIMTLSEIRAEKRAPDFFELLKAGILAGSLGGNPGEVAVNVSSSVPAEHAGPIGRDFEVYSADQDRHILQIGANIIDQADSDNYPTAIHMELVGKFGGSERDFYNTVFGLENLPLLQRIGVINAMLGNHTTTAPFPSGQMGIWFQPEVWNPHHRTTAGSGTGDPLHPTPTALRLTTFGRVYIWNYGEDPSMSHLSTPIDFGTDFRNPSVEGIIAFKNPEPNSTALQDFFAAPMPLKGFEKAAGGTVRYRYNDGTSVSGPNNRYPENINWVSQSRNSNQFLGVFAGHVMRDPQNASQYELRPIIDGNLTFVLEYFDGIEWRPYHSLGRLKSLHSNSGGGGSRQGNEYWRSFDGHIDPRTTRLSGSAARNATGANEGWNPGTTVRAAKNDSVTIGNTLGRGPIEEAWPRPEAGFVHNPVGGFYLFDDWMRNRDAATPYHSASSFRYADPDGVVRPGDAWRANLDTGDGMMSFHEDQLPVTADRRRPVILNRPFRSVGELGYVFRDQPFKTLDFWSEKSADGGVLDLFSVSFRSSEITAGLFNPNSAPPSTLTSVLSGIRRQNHTSSVLDAGTAKSTAEAVQGHIGSANQLLNRSGLGEQISETFFTALTNSTGSDEFRNKSYGEAAVRAVGEVTTTRTWNVLVDVVAQTGRVSANAGALQDFLVEGERRYWLHLALDRQTGAIIDHQLEPVLE